jgi:hypothetical protein
MAYSIHVCGPAKILEATAVVIDQVEGQAFNLGNDRRTLSTAGNVYPTFSALMNQAPRFSLTTSQIAAVLTKVSTKGLALATGFEVFNQAKSTTTGLPTTGATHQKLAIATGLVIPRQLSCSQGGLAKLTFDVVGINASGTTNPVTMTENTNTPTITGISEQFTLGPVKINGTNVEGVQDVTIDFGLRERILEGSGAYYPQLVALDTVAPKVTIRTNDAAVLANFGLTGLAQAATDSVIYFRKMAANGIRTADVTGAHVSFTIDDGLFLVGDKGGNHPGELSTTLEIEPIHDGTNEPLVYSGSAAIS